ncbi:hypothetical protein ACFP3Q_17815 [Nocardioides sp. GCM10027113]|uniref:hypothetical protein n=1 Tax=unclassified Nocardioides TaxID=2615069 RepID=UPI00361EA896
MRRPFLMLVAGLLALAVVPAAQPPALASCVAPNLDRERRAGLERGTTVTVAGRAFVDGCRDTMSCRVLLGCSSCEHDEPEPVPYAGVRLVLEQGERRWDLGVVDADEDGSVVWSFELPAGVERGRAVLVADHAAPLAVRVG